jgi:predicted permease
VEIRRAAAIGFAGISAGVVAFQISLAAGAPWGSAAMGGSFPGQYPPAMRVAAVFQAAIIALIAGVILSRAGVAFPGWSRASRRLVWVVAAFLAVGLVLNLATPSAAERAIWAPVSFLLLVCSLIVATGRPPSE